MKLRELVLLAILTTILFVVEQLLTFIPNIQLTFLIIIIYSKVFKLKTLFIILIHVLLDNLFMGSFNMMYIPFMFLGYSIIPITLYFIKTNNEIHLALLSVIFSFIYCFLFVIPSSITTGVKFRDYLIADIPFTIILSISSFVTVLWLYKPISQKLIQFKNKNDSE